MILYQIRNWDSHFENNKSRERNDCSFVCVPNKQHGLGFQRVVSEKDGAMIYGIWHMIVGTCSRQKKPRLGWLTQDGHQTGTALTPDDLAMKFRRPVKEIERALEFLSSPRVGWMIRHELTEVVGNQSQALSAREVPAECPDGALEEKRREEDGIEQERREGECPPSKFSNARIALHWLNEKAGRHYRETSENLTLVHNRLAEVGDDLEGVKLMICRQVEKWRGDPKMEGYLRPETLFGKQKFSGYYDERNLPIPTAKKAPEANQVQETIQVRNL